jgi:ectoine hydroxylase-related dioxygenase (phytanoyl-CoA dioxygenase family)
MHNNAFCIKPGMRGQAAVWHQDDAPLFTSVSGEPLSEEFIVAPMVITCMYYLNDIRGEVDGMTQVIPGSHRFGIPCNPSVASVYDYVVPAVTKGTALLISSSVWHKGAPVFPEGSN